MKKSQQLELQHTQKNPGIRKSLNEKKIRIKV